MHVGKRYTICGKFIISMLGNSNSALTRECLHLGESIAHSADRIDWHHSAAILLCRPWIANASGPFSSTFALIHARNVSRSRAIASQAL
jgi:hypothetical protein